MRATNFINFFILNLSISVCVPLAAISQACNGHWVNNRPFTFQCISGQLIGQPSPTGDPPGCPINPIYTSLQTNTFIFNVPVNDFFIDFNAFDGISPGCSRMQIKINGTFYSLNNANLTELPTGTSCSGSISFLAITSDGYITTSMGSSNGQGRLIFSGVNAANITISSNDAGGGVVVANPCFAPLPIQLKSFKGFATSYCDVNLEFESGLESNVRNIEIEGSFDGTDFSKLYELLPRGSDSRYVVQLKSSGNIFYRLKINDLDGSFSYSQIIRISNNCSNSHIRIYPNPSIQKILIENVQPNDQLIIVDVTGREVIRVQIKSSSSEINVQHLISGIYFVKLIRQGIKVDTLKFIKQ